MTAFPEFWRAELSATRLLQAAHGFPVVSGALCDHALGLGEHDFLSHTKVKAFIAYTLTELLVGVGLSLTLSPGLELFSSHRAAPSSLEVRVCLVLSH